MEHFEGHEQQVKQKSVYLVHLDTPRIILISAVIIGIITASFLIGMNFVKGGDEITPASTESLFSGDSKSATVFDEAIPAPPHRNDEADTGVMENALQPQDEVVKSDELTAPIAQNSQPDVITSETIKEIIPPAVKPKPERKSVAKAKRPARVAKASRAAKEPRKSHRAREASVPVKKKYSAPVVEAADSYSRKHDSASPAFAVQIASYDRKTRAMNEAGKLRDMHYDTYIDSSEVNGRQFYRVRIGPVSRKDSALKILREVQSMERYAESYLVRE